MRFRIELTTRETDAAAVRLLRSALKRLLRCYGLRCTSAEAFDLAPDLNGDERKEGEAGNDAGEKKTRQGRT